MFNFSLWILGTIGNQHWLKISLTVSNLALHPRRGIPYQKTLSHHRFCFKYSISSTRNTTLQLLKGSPMLKAKTIIPCTPMSHSIQLFSKIIIFREISDMFILKLSHWLSFVINENSVEKWVARRWSSDKMESYALNHQICNITSCLFSVIFMGG